MSPQYGELQPTAAEIVSLVWDTLAIFSGFRVLASLLQRHRLMEANQTLHNVWPLPGLVGYIHVYIFFRRLLLRNGILPGAKITIHFASSKSCALLLAVLLHRSRSVGMSQTLRR